MAGMAAIDRYPAVIKADGLAAGKGVIIAQDEAAGARSARRSCSCERRFGTERVVVEEHLDGEELSLLALCDGQTALPLASAQDYKRIFDGDRGPNTGGMGSYSPVPGDRRRSAPPRSARLSTSRCSTSSARRGIPFHGVLYAGLMMTADGPEVLEFNVRFGDPGDAGDPAAAAHRPARAARGRDRPGRAARRRARVGAGHGGDRRAREPRLPGELVERRS